MVRAWRIVRPRHLSTAFTGEGARRFGGRFNNPGIAVVYTAGSASLAVLEMLVHLGPEHPQARYALIPVQFDEHLVTTVTVESLPPQWRQSPPPPAVAEVGDRWVGQGRSAVLRVPSAVVPWEWNYLINPAHGDFRHIRIEPAQPFDLDPRLTDRGGSQRDRSDPTP